MKKILFRVLIAFTALFTACSDDDSGLTVNNESSQLKRVETLLGPNDAVLPGQTVLLKRIQHYDQGEIVADTVFDLTGNYHYYTLYSVSGNIHTATTYKANNTVQSVYTKAYDSAGRITMTEFMDYEYRKSVISYDTNGTITADVIGYLGGTPTSIAFAVNPDGYIESMTVDNQISTLTYENDKPAMFTESFSGVIATSYNYNYYEPSPSQTSLSPIEINNKILERGDLRVSHDLPEYKGINNETYYDKTFDSLGRITHSNPVTSLGNYPDITYYYE